MVIQRGIISPDEATTPEEDLGWLEDLGARSKKHPAPEPGEGEGGSMGLPPGKKPKKAKQAKTPKPKKDPQAKEAQEGEERQKGSQVE